MVRHPYSEDLAAGLIVRQVDSADLLGELVIRRSDSEDLPGEFIVRPAGSRSLGAGFIVRQAASQDLAASFDGQVTRNLLGEFIVRHSAYAGSPSQPQYLGKFTVRRDGLQDLAAGLIVTQPESADLLGEFTVRPAGTQNLAGAFVVRHPGSQDLAASFDGQVSLNLPGEFISRQAGSRSLPGALIIRHPGSEELPAEFIIRRSASGDLGAEFISRQPGSQDLLGAFTVRQSASQDLAASFDGQVSLNVSGKFIVRQPWPFWTNRYWLNGVVQLEEANLSDSFLEEVITGVMDDIKTWLIGEEIGQYSGWTDIEVTPRAIRRAATYGTVASLYARHIFGPKNQVVRLPPMDVKIFTTSEDAMEYWEGMMMRVLDLYLAGEEQPRIWIDTLQEDPIFTMEDIPRYTWNPDDYTITQR